MGRLAPCLVRAEATWSCAAARSRGSNVLTLEGDVGVVAIGDEIVDEEHLIGGVVEALEAEDVAVAEPGDGTHRCRRR